MHFIGFLPPIVVIYNLCTSRGGRELMREHSKEYGATLVSRSQPDETP